MNKVVIFIVIIFQLCSAKEQMSKNMNTSFVLLFAKLFL